MNIRTRFAPSPTGSLHIGSVRTALFCYALAKKHEGQFIVRIEDTDEKRKVEGALETIFSGLDLLGLTPDESPRHGGEYGPYTQSERINIYREYAQQLIDNGHAYYCFLAGEELEQLKLQFKGRGFRSPYRDVVHEDVQKRIDAGEPYVIRLKVPNGEILEYEDGTQGKMRFKTEIVSDEILIKSSGMASYHLAVVVDDYLMKVSHVFRGIEWLPSTPKQILIHQYLGLEMPAYYHLPLILDPDGGKLSKRKGAVAVHSFFEEGYIAEALLNFMMLLGWSSPEERVHGEKEREFYSLAEFVSLFDPADLNKSNGIFNRKKLAWFNKQYLMQLGAEGFQGRLIQWLERYAAEDAIHDHIVQDTELDKKIQLIFERSETLQHAVDMLRFFYTAPTEIDWDIKQMKRVDESLRTQLLTSMLDILGSFAEEAQDWDHAVWEQALRELGDTTNVKHGDVFMILRLAVCGSPFSPPLFESLQLLGKKEVIKRLKVASSAT